MNQFRSNDGSEQAIEDNEAGARSFFHKEKKGGKTIEKFYIKNINTYLVNKGDDYNNNYESDDYGYPEYSAPAYGYGGNDYGSGYGMLNQSQCATD